MSIKSFEKYSLKCETDFEETTAMVRVIDMETGNIDDVVEIIGDFLKAVGYCDSSIKKAFYNYSDEQSGEIRKQTINEYYDAFGNFSPRRFS